MCAKITFNRSLTKIDPQDTSVLIIGQVANLTKVKYDDLYCKFEPRVTEEIYKSAIYSLHPSPTDIRYLYLHLAAVAALPTKCSRHNTPSRSHAITRLVQNWTVGVDESVVVVCERKDVFASGCAVARAFPTYTRKTSSSNVNNSKVSIEFLIVPATRKDNEFKDNQLSEEEVAVLEHASFGIRLTAGIVDTPCNEMNVDGFLKEIRTIGEKLKITPTVIRGQELADRGFGGIFGVGKASTCPPALAVLSYTPPGATTTIAWVGKGIVYDTGGLSIKGKTTMPGMKRDCGGAAAVLGAFYAAVKANFTQNLHAVFCLAENSVGPNATRPDDIHTLYSGRTVEINNTDAEGRLVLSDGVVYAQRDLKAHIILDIATLTGAQGIATGKYHAAILTNNEDWEDMCVEAALTSGDLVFPLPYCPELHFSEFASAIADMKNSVADRSNAQSSCAGLFIAAHLGFDYPGVWIHVDMALPVHSGERATGYGVALLTTLFGKYCKNTLLNEISPEIEPKVQMIPKKNAVLADRRKHPQYTGYINEKRSSNVSPVSLYRRNKQTTSTLNSRGAPAHARLPLADQSARPPIAAVSTQDRLEFAENLRVTSLSSTTSSVAVWWEKMADFTNKFFNKTPFQN